MRKNFKKLTALPLFTLAALPALFAGLAYAAAPFVQSNPVVIGYTAQPALTNFNLLSGKESVYRAEYEKGAWSGNLSCYPISAAGVVNVTAPCWSSGTALTARSGAQSQVDLQGFTSGSRNIATLDVTGKAVPFTLSVDTGSLLDANHVNFIRGDRSQEAPSGILRNRTSALGDSIHSRPYYLSDGVTPTVFYGANDGMLHAINASTGAERWAYIPSMLVAKLNKLWVTPYVHEYYVDGSVNVSNVGTTAAPQNILVGTLGQGGKGIYALDVTTLTAAADTDAASKALWEITPAAITKGGVRSNSTSYANMGDTFSTPTLYPVETGANAVIVGNGYNNAGNGHATLLVIDTKTGALIKEIDTGVGTVASPNGLSTPAAVDSNSNGLADIVFAGDINGNMWKFDMTSSSPTAWKAILLYNTANNAATPAGQPITMMPGVARHPNGGYMVTFATGQLFTAADNLDASFYYAYGVWDSAPTSNTTMTLQTIQTRDYVTALGATPIPVRIVGSTPEGATIMPNWAAGGDKGWITQLPAAGERVTGDSAFIQYGRFVFNATNPLVTYTPLGGAKNSGKGENWLMELDYLSGGGVSAPFFDLDGNGVLDNSDRIRYIAGDIATPPNAVGTPILTNFGVPIGLPTSNGVQSQPMLGGLGNFSAIFFNQNYNLAQSPVIVVPPGATGVGNGHFDVDLFYNTGSPGFVASCTGGTLSADGQGCVQGTCIGGTVNAAGTACSTAANNMCIGGGSPNSTTKTCSATQASPALGTCMNGVLLNDNGNGVGTGCTTATVSQPLCFKIRSNGQVRQYNATTSRDCTNQGGTYFYTSGTPGTFTITIPAVLASPGGTYVAQGTTLGTWSALTSPGVFSPSIPQATTNYSTQGTHVHEYDKSYDVNGLNMLNPNDTNMAMSNARITSLTPYKVLLMNQSWNRAMFFKVADTTWSTKDYQTGTNNASATYNSGVSMTGTALGVGALNLASVTTYKGNSSTVLTSSTDPVTKKVKVLTVQTSGTIGGVLGAAGGPRDSVGGLELAMPYDAFSIKDWWGDGMVQTGVMPTAPSCPDDSNTNTGAENANKSGAKNQFIGPLGERNNGVITVQLIKDNTPDSAVQLNVPGRPDLGFRVMDNQILNYVLAEYIVYWHHPMNICMGDYASTPGDAGNAWSATNNSGDPWWPAKATKSGWIGTAPKGWTIAPPPDLATTKPPTPSYSTAADDPRSASFITATLGTGGVGAPTPTVATNTVAVSVGLVGGTIGGSTNTVSCNAGSTGCVCVGTTCTTTVACGGTGQPVCNNAVTTPPCGTIGQPACTQLNTNVPTGRLSWRELIGN